MVIDLFWKEVSNSVILTADYLITGDGVTVIEQGGVRIEGDKILEVGPAAQLIAAHPEQEVQAHPGCTLMPGMIDLHNHLAYIYGRAETPDFEKYPAMQGFFVAQRMEDTLRAGVTTIRDLASPNYMGVAVIKGRRYGFLKAPRVFTAGCGICMTGGHGSGLDGSVMECDGEWEVRKAVRTNAREGANCIKILTSHGNRGLEMSQEEINAAVDEAHRLGLRVASHAGYDPSIQMSIDGGCDTIEHGTHLTIAQAQQMKAHDQTWVPTIYVFDYCYQLYTEMGLTSANEIYRYLEEANACYRDNFKALYDTGVRVACGTDTDCCDHPKATPVWVECDYMVRYGITPLQAIECATKNGAEALGMGDRLGQLKADYIADVIAVEGKPHEDVKALEHVSAVYQEGKRVEL